MPMLKRAYTQAPGPGHGQQMEAYDKLNILHSHTIEKKQLPGIDLVTSLSVCTLIAGFILVLISGLTLCVGAITPYIVSFFRLHLKYEVDYDTF